MENIAQVEISNADFVKGLNEKFPGALEKIRDGEWVLNRHDEGSAYTYLLSEKHGVVNFLLPTDVAPADLSVDKMFEAFDNSEVRIKSMDVKDVLRDDNPERNLVVGDKAIMFGKVDFEGETQQEKSEQYRFLLRDLEIASKATQEK